MEKQLSELLRVHLKDEAMKDSVQMSATLYSLEKREFFQEFFNIFHEEQVNEAWRRVDKFINEKEKIANIISKENVSLDDYEFVLEKINEYKGVKEVFAETMNPENIGEAFSCSREKLLNLMELEEGNKEHRETINFKFENLIRFITSGVQSKFHFIERGSDFVILNKDKKNDNLVLTGVKLNTSKGNMLIVSGISEHILFLENNNDILFVRFKNYNNSSIKGFTRGKCEQLNEESGFHYLNGEYHKTRVFFDEENRLVHESKNMDGVLLFYSIALSNLKGKSIAFSDYTTNQFMDVFDGTRFRWNQYILSEDVDMIIKNIIKENQKCPTNYKIKDIKYLNEIEEMLELHYSF